MTQGSKPEGDVLLHRDSTEVLRELAVYDSNPSNDIVQARPSEPDLIVQGNPDRSRDAALSVRTDSGAAAGTIDVSGKQGRLTVGDDAGRSVVELDTAFGQDGQVRVLAPERSQSLMAKFATVEKGGKVTVHHGEVGHPVVDIRADQAVREKPGGGHLQLRPREATTTVDLDARDASLVLRSRSSGTPTDPDHNKGPSLVLQQYASRDVDEDVQIHVAGEQASNYGVDANNRPRISIDGYDATVEIGRGETPNGYDGANGGINLRGFSSGPQQPLAQATVLAGGSSQERTATLLLRNDDSNSVSTSGQIQSRNDGLLVKDQTGSPALLIDTSGTVKTAASINRGALSNVGPSIVSVSRDVPTGTVGEFAVVAGDDSTFTIRISGGGSPSYTIDATVTPGSDARLGVRFDTSAAGTSRSTLSIVGDATLTINNETSFSGSLQQADYSFEVSDSYGSDRRFFNVT